MFLWWNAKQAQQSNVRSMARTRSQASNEMQSKQTHSEVGQICASRKHLCVCYENKQKQWPILVGRLTSTDTETKQ